MPDELTKSFCESVHERSGTHASMPRRVTGGPSALRPVFHPCPLGALARARHHRVNRAAKSAENSGVRPVSVEHEAAVRPKTFRQAPNCVLRGGFLGLENDLFVRSKAVMVRVRRGVSASTDCP